MVTIDTVCGSGIWCFFVLFYPRIQGAGWEKDPDPGSGMNITLSGNHNRSETKLGLSYRPARLHGLAGRHNNPMPEPAISPSRGLRIYLQKCAVGNRLQIQITQLIITVTSIQRKMFTFMLRRERTKKYIFKK